MKPYASYKPSGVAWLGDVPAHWISAKLKFRLERNDGGAWGADPEGANDTLVLRSTEQTVDGRWKLEDPAYRKLSPTEAEATLLVEGDLLVTKSSGSETHIGKTSLVDAEIATLRAGYSNFMQRLRVVHEVIPKYVWYLLNSGTTKTQVNILASTTTGLANLNAGVLGQLILAYPPPDEQQAIADYLDTETARIDTLVQEKDELIGLLREAQASAFAATVLRFATAAAGVKCNRFAWLDSLPTSWRIAKVKHLTLSVDQGISPQCESRPPDDGEWGVLKVGCVNTGDFNAMESKALPSDIMPIEHITLLKGDVLISRANTKNLVGRAAMADKDYPRLMLSDKHYRLRLDESECLPQYLVFVLTHSAVRVHIEERATGASASMLNIDRRTIMDLEIPLPPVELQDEIVREVQADREALARLITHTQEEIALLKELRAATIADAVLGRVDVRSLTQKK